MDTRGRRAYPRDHGLRVAAGSESNEALARIQRRGFPEMTRQRWRVSTQIGDLPWVFVIAFARDPIAWRPGSLLESRSILRLTRVSGDATRP